MKEIHERQLIPCEIFPSRQDLIVDAQDLVKIFLGKGYAVHIWRTESLGSKIETGNISQEQTKTTRAKVVGE